MERVEKNHKKNGRDWKKGYFTRLIGKVCGDVDVIVVVLEERQSDVPVAEEDEDRSGGRDEHEAPNVELSSFDKQRVGDVSARN